MARLSCHQRCNSLACFDPSMLAPDLAQQIQLIELQARKILTGNLSGEYHTRLKGAGLEFDQVREYSAGDDIRFIDWKSSARTGRLLTKQYLDERNRTVMILLDISASNRFGDQQQLMAQIAALLAAVAHYGKDRVGLSLFAGEVLKYVAPNRGLAHLMGLYQDIFVNTNATPATAAAPITSLKKALELVAQRTGRERLLLFIISDLIVAEDYQWQLSLAAQQHDVIVLRCLDPQAQQLPNWGLLTVADLESGVSCELESAQYAQLNQLLQQRFQAQTQQFRQLGVELLELVSQAQIVTDLVRLFQQRVLY